MDEAGEAALLAFTHAQLGNLGMALIALAAAVRGPKDWRLSWQRYLARAWWRGRRARWLVTVPWEEWLGRPLVCVRRDLRVEAPELAHPGGVLVAEPETERAVFTRGRALSANG
jgi:ubiquinone biosynthesis protein Coq4